MIMAGLVLTIALQANRARDIAEVQRWLDMIESAQVYTLKRLGCYRPASDPKVITHDLTHADCGKAPEIDWKASERARKLAMQIWGLRDK